MNETDWDEEEVFFMSRREMRAVALILNEATQSRLPVHPNQLKLALQVKVRLWKEVKDLE